MKNTTFTATEQTFLNLKEVKANLELSKFERASKAAGNYRIKAFERTIVESQLLAKGCNYLQSSEGKKLRKEHDVFKTKVDYGKKIYGVGKALINRLHSFGSIEDEFFTAYIQFGEENNLMFTSSIEIVMKVHEVLKNDDSKYTSEDVKDVFDAWATKDDKAKSKGGTIFSLKEDGNYNVSGDPKEVAALLLEIAKQLLETE
tara:strand:- start:728 stop:1333 length:606 start_codon:yes stop_codon:yes gene_type:complete